MATAYDIFIHITMQNGVSPVLALIAKDMLGLETSAKRLEMAFANVGGSLKVMAAGGVGLFAGYEIAKGLSAWADKGMEIIHQQQLMKAAGYDVLQQQLALNAAWQIASDIKVTSPAENLKHIRELAYATGDVQSAIGILPMTARANAILNSVTGGGQDEVFNLVKALEQKGLATAENQSQFASYVNTMTKVVEASGGKVTPSSFQSAFIYGRTAMLGWDEQFITEIMPRLIQSWAGGGSGGSGVRGPGNALMSAWSKVVGGQLSKSSKAEFETLGLGEMTPKGFEVKGTLEFGKNPYDWVQNYLVPALKQHGVDIKDATAVGMEAYRLMGIRTAASVMEEFVLQGKAALGTASPFEKDARITRQAGGILSYDDLVKNDPSVIMKEVASRWATIGDSLAPLASIKLDFLRNDVIPFLDNLASLSHLHPEALKATGEALVALSVGLMALGAVGITVGLVALGGAAVCLQGLRSGSASGCAQFRQAAKHRRQAADRRWTGSIIRSHRRSTTSCANLALSATHGLHTGGAGPRGISISPIRQTFRALARQAS